MPRRMGPKLGRVKKVKGVKGLGGKRRKTGGAKGRRKASGY